MTEIKQPDINNLDLDKLSPEQRAKLLEALNRQTESNAELSPSVENPSLASPDQAGASADQKDSLEIARPIQTVVPQESTDLRKPEVLERQNILDDLINGKLSLDGFKVTPDNASDVVDEITSNIK